MDTQTAGPAGSSPGPLWGVSRALSGCSPWDPRQVTRFHYPLNTPPTQCLAFSPPTGDNPLLIPISPLSPVFPKSARASRKDLKKQQALQTSWAFAVVMCTPPPTHDMQGTPADPLQSLPSDQFWGNTGIRRKPTSGKQKHECPCHGDWEFWKVW